MLAGLRQSLRTVARAPLTAATTILCLGAGMAATTSAFAIMNGIIRGELFRSPRYQCPEHNHHTV
jgi:hypothetical protein